HGGLAALFDDQPVHMFAVDEVIEIGVGGVKSIGAFDNSVSMVRSAIKRSRSCFIWILFSRAARHKLLGDACFVGRSRYVQRRIASVDKAGDLLEVVRTFLDPLLVTSALDRLTNVVSCCASPCASRQRGCSLRLLG